jgi:hypothetical protein
MHARRVRAFSWFLVAVLAGCRPSAKVERTMPVASLQTYRTVALRVKSTAFAAQGLASLLETRVLEGLRQRCGFEQVGPASDAPVDVVLDLNIINTARGGGGFIQNSSQATVDTLLVLSDGTTSDLLGTARIRGKSGGMILNDALPENDAIEAVAKSVVDLLGQSGCSGPRLAKLEPLPPPPDANPDEGGGETPPDDEKRRADAEALNEAGKTKLQDADMQGAIAAFQAANALVPDARYGYNLCVAFEAAERFADALTACDQARGMTTEARLIKKIDLRLEALRQRK